MKLPDYTQVSPDAIVAGIKAKDLTMAACTFVRLITPEVAKSLKRELREALRAGKTPPLMSRLGLFHIASGNPHIRPRSQEDVVAAMRIITHLLTPSEQRKWGIAKIGKIKPDGTLKADPDAAENIARVVEEDRQYRERN